MAICRKHKDLTLCVLVTSHEYVYIEVIIGPGEGLLPRGPKPLPEPLLPSARSSDTLRRTITQEIPQPLITKITLKFTYLSFHWSLPGANELTHWGRVTHICVSKLTTIGSDNGLSPGRRQAIIWTNAGILLIWPLGTNFSEILIGIQTFSIKKMHLKMSSAKRRPFGLGLNVLRL